MTGTSVTPTARMSGIDALSCPLPPSIIMRSGIGQSVSLPYRRSMISAIDLKSSGFPCVVFNLKRLYSFLAGLPPSNTTMEATVSEPCVWEISKHSIRSGNRGKSSTSANFLTAPPLLSIWYCHWRRRSSRNVSAFS